MPANDSIAALNLDEYKYGFRDEVDYAYKSRKGLDEEIVTTIQQTAVTAYRALKLRDYGRIDMRLAEDGRVYVLEANPNPWLDPAAEFAMAAKESGRTYTQMIGEIVEAAMRR